jgi:hypothetical protein
VKDWVSTPPWSTEYPDLKNLMNGKEGVWVREGDREKRRERGKEREDVKRRSEEKREKSVDSNFFFSFYSFYLFIYLFL